MKSEKVALFASAWIETKLWRAKKERDAVALFAKDRGQILQCHMCMIARSDPEVCDGQKPPYMRIYCESFNDVQRDRTEKRDQAKKTAAEIPQGIGVKALNNYVDQYIDADNAGSMYELPIFIYYGTGRGVFDIPQRKKGFGKSFSRFYAFSGALESRALRVRSCNATYA